MVAVSRLLFYALLLSAAFPQSETIQKARDHLTSGEFEQAAQELAAEVKRNPHSAEAHLLLAYAEQKANLPADAVREYKRAIALDSRSFPAHFNLALLCIEQKDAPTAIRELQSAAALEPQNADAQYDLAVLVLDAGHPSEALSHLARAKQIQPDRRDVQFQTIRAYVAGRRFFEARQETHPFLSGHVEDTAAVSQLFLDADDPADVLALIPDPTTANDHYLRGAAFFGMGELQAALTESGRAMELEPSNPRFLLLTGKLYQRLGSGEAEALLDRAIQLSPDWYEPYYSRSVSSYFQHNYDAAATDVRKALSLNQQCARCAFLEGVICFNQGELAKSETAFRRAILLEPENSRFRTHLAALMMRSGRNGQAKAELSKAIQLSPGYGLPHYELGKLLASAARFEDAANELEEARRLDPYLTETLYQLGQMYLKLGQKSRAEEVLQEFRKARAKQNERASPNDDAFDSALAY